MKKKILFLITTLNNGGAEKVLVDTANLLSQEDFDITVQTLMDEGYYRNKLNSKIKYKSILKSQNRVIRKIFRIFMKAFPRLIYKKFIKAKYDMEIAFLEGMPTRLISYSTEKKSKKLAWVHTDFLKYFNSNNDYRSFKEHKNSYRAFDKIACVSNDVKTSFREVFELYDVNTETVYNIVLDEEIKRRSLEAVEDLNVKYSPLFVSCGRLCEQKGFKRLLKIHKELCQEGLKHTLLIIGDGEERNVLEEYVEKHNLTETVKLLGYKENPYKYMRKSDIYVCSSYAEGFSTVITEATILGIPVISVQTAGANEPEYASRCNIVVENSDDELYKALRMVLDNKGLINQYKEEQKTKLKYYETKYLIRNLLKFLED